MRTLSSSLTTLGHLGCDRRGDQSGGEKELHFGAMVAENTRRCATAPPDAFSDKVLENLGATPHEGHEKVGFPEVSPNAPALQHNAPDGPRSSPPMWRRKFPSFSASLPVFSTDDCKYSRG